MNVKHGTERDGIWMIVPRETGLWELKESEKCMFYVIRIFKGYRKKFKCTKCQGYGTPVFFLMNLWNNELYPTYRWLARTLGWRLWIFFGLTLDWNNIWNKWRDVMGK